MTLQWNAFKRDISKGDSLDRVEGDSSVVTPDNRDSTVQPIKSVHSMGDSADFTLDELGHLVLSRPPNGT